jgi:hypothetical protein
MRSSIFHKESDRPVALFRSRVVKVNHTMKRAIWIPACLTVLAVSLVVKARTSAPLVTPGETAERSEMATLRASLLRTEKELQRMRSVVPEQSIAMLGVAQQFTNLWYAADRANWPLAEFFLDETIEAIEWTVRIKPVHQVPTVGDVDLKAIFESLEQALIPELKSSIEAHDHGRFTAAYRNMLQGCYACHKAVGKPYLRPTTPTEPSTRIINFDPNATWPQ